MTRVRRHPHDDRTQLWEAVAAVADKCAQRAHAGGGPVDKPLGKPAKGKPKGYLQKAEAEARSRARGKARHAWRRPRRFVKRWDRRAKLAVGSAVVSAKVARKTVVVGARAVRHPLRSLNTLLVCLLMLVWLTPVTFPQAWHGLTGAVGAGARLVPSACVTTTQLPRGGEVGVGYTVGHAVGGLQEAKVPNAEALRKGYIDGAYRLGLILGRGWAAFREAMGGGAQPMAAPTTTLPPAQQVAACCGTQAPIPPGGIPTAYHPQLGDTPGMVSARAAQARGLSGEPLVRAVAVAYAESGNRDVQGPRNTDGTYDWGRWQINDVHADLLAAGDWRNPYDNAAMMMAVSNNGTDWSPWTTDRNGKANGFMDQARADVRAVVGFTGPVGDVEPAAYDPVVPVATCTPTGYTGGPAVLGTPTAEAAIARAMGQRGVPYSWGGGGIAGPSRGIGSGAGTVGFDCSGLVEYAYQLPGSPTTRELIGMGQRITPGQEQRGDLVFPDSGHVGIALGDGTYIEAPHTGDVVKVAPYGSPWAVVRLGAARVA